MIVYGRMIHMHLKVKLHLWNNYEAIYVPSRWSGTEVVAFHVSKDSKEHLTISKVNGIIIIIVMKKLITWSS